MELTATATTLAALIDAVAVHVPAVLLPPAGTAALRAIAARVPFVPAMGLECHLGVEPRRVDLSAGEGISHGALAATIARVTDGRISAASLALGGALAQRVDTLALEFDVASDGPARDPAVFLALRPGVANDAKLVTGLGAALLGELHPRTAALLRRCVAGLDVDTEIAHIGAMCGRPERPLRLNAGAVSAGALRRYAAAIGMPAERRAALDGVLDTVTPYAHHLVLAIDLARDVLPRFGVESYLRAAEDVDGWRAVLARLCDLGLCSAAEASALLRWPGRTVPANPAWPAQRRRVSQFLGAGASDVVQRAINHVKLVAAPGEPLRAKAYLVARCVYAGDTP